MAALFKYFSEEKYALAFLEHGEVFMQTLAHFRAYDDENVRGDRNDGVLRYQPEDGLQLNMINGETRQLPPGSSFVSSVRQEDIYVFCLSTILSVEVAERFNSKFCVELEPAGRLVGAIKTSVRLRSQLDRNVYSGLVEYRDLKAPPIVAWALPEKVAFIKPESWSWQQEFRIVVGRKGTFSVENVSLTIETAPSLPAQPKHTDPLLLRVGSLARNATLHRF